MVNGSGAIDVRATMRAALLELRNADGGWAYLRGRRSRLEPTCWAVLALAHTGGQITADVLRHWPRENGWIADVPSAPPNVAFNAIVALTVLQTATDTAEVDPLIARLIAAKGETYAHSDVLRQDNGLAAWPWIQGTISWVEPTAWCLMVLKQRRVRGRSIAGLDQRIEIGERMLIDRVCREGGWNYGNSRVYESDLLPHVPTTALGLLAMQDRRTHPIVQRSLARLRADVETEQSPLALSLATICLRVFGEPMVEAERTLADLCERRRTVPDENENVHGLAAALYALTSIDRQAPAFTV
jgi:hypothetical protein